MCGILAYFSFDNPSIDRNPIRKSLEMVKHRGPDGMGMLFGRDRYILNGRSEDAFNWALGHQRLAILDLSSAGIQPMSYDNSCYWIIHNGEVYNYSEIRNELKELGYGFISETDTEVILAAYAQWGERCVERFIGMFAFVLLDLKTCRVMVARDRLGVKPMYLWSDGRALVAVSELKQLAAFPSYKNRCNKQQLVDFVVDGVLGHEPQECFYEGVHQLPPGHTLAWSLGSAPELKNVRPYWQPSTTSVQLSWPDALERTASILKDAVRVRFRSDVPVGSCLSGGIDSSSIVGISKHIFGHDLHTFSSCFRDQHINEEHYMDSVIEYCHCDPVKVFPNEEGLIDDLDALVYHQDEPFGTLSLYAQWCVMRAARNAYVPVLLDGQGGDEALCGYKKYSFFMMRHYWAKKQWGKLIKHGVQIILNGDRRLFDWKSGQRYLPGFIRRRYDDMTSLLRPHWKNFVRNIWYERMKNTECLHEYQFADLQYWSIPALLRYEDRNSMAFSIETRLPFLDHRFVEHCLHLPEEHFFRNGRTKRVLVDAFDGVLPDLVKERRTKLGFETPQERWLVGKIGCLLEERLKRSKRFHEIFDPVMTKKMLHEYRSGSSQYSHFALFRIISVALWAEAFHVEF